MADGPTPQGRVLLVVSSLRRTCTESQPFYDSMVQEVGQVSVAELLRLQRAFEHTAACFTRYASCFAEAIKSRAGEQEESDAAPLF